LAQVREELGTLGATSFSTGCLACWDVATERLGKLRTFQDLESGASMQAHSLRSAESGNWLLSNNGTVQSLVPRSLARSVPLERSTQSHFMPDGQLLSLNQGELHLSQPPATTPSVVVQPLLPSGAVASVVVEISPETVLVADLQDPASSQYFAVALSDGQSITLPAEFVRWRFNGDGSWLYSSNEGTVALVEVASGLTTQRVFGDRGQAWLSETGRYLVFENDDGVGWVDLDTGNERFADGRNLRSFELANERLWTLGEQGLDYLELSTGAWLNVNVDDCLAQEAAVSADGQSLVVRCGEDNPNTVVFINATTGRESARVAL
jgi:hypothetical protein